MNDYCSKLGLHYVAQDLGTQSQHVYSLSAVNDFRREVHGQGKPRSSKHRSLLGLCAAGYLMLKKDSDIRKITHNVDSILGIFTDDEIT